VLGVNLGHVGFLAEAEVDEVSTVVRAVVDRRWTVEERTTLEVVVTQDGTETARTWALNEASVEKASRERMLEVLVAVDDRPLSRWGCDGVVAATPTGSTAYAFSAGGPVVWPEVEALLVVPISAHALFARPLVVSPTSTVTVQIDRGASAGAVLWCDGRRLVELAAGARVDITRHPSPVRLARLHTPPFTDRLVAKFDLPVEGWRARRRPEGSGP
jgi:NAD+ kinase